VWPNGAFGKRRAPYPASVFAIFNGSKMPEEVRERFAGTNFDDERQQRKTRTL
jgi:hypothetical protein